MDLLRVIAANGGLDREDFRRNGVDPAELGRRAGFHYVFRKRGKDGAARGMTLSDLREFMQQEGYLPADSPDRPAEVDDNDALDVFDRAFRGGEEVYAPDQMDAIAAYRERQEAENDAFREEEARAAVQSGSDAEFDAFLNGETQDVDGAPQDGFERGFDVLLQQAMDLGATDAQIMDAFNGDVNEGLQSLINRLETETDGREQDFAGQEAGASEVRARAAQRAGTGPGELPPEPGRAPGGIPSEAGEEVADSSPARGGLFAAPTTREQVDAARRDRDAARDGRTGSGRTDIQAGGGELFAGPRPEQTQIDEATNLRPAAGDNTVELGTVGESRAATGRPIGTTSNFFSRPDRSLFNVVNQLKEGTRTPPQTRAQVTAAITGITSKWKGDRPRVVVLESAEGLPEHVKSDPAYRTAEGFYDQATRTAYLVAPNIRGGYDMALKRQVSPRERAQMVLAHEVIGHYAIEDITGPELWRQIGDAVQRMREGGEQADLFAEIDRRNPGASQEVLLKETLAVMAEKGVRNSIMDRIAAAVRRFLRAMGFDLRVSDAELRQHIARAARHVEVAADAAAPAGGQAGETFPSRPDLDLRKQVPVVNMAGGVFGDPARELKAVRTRVRDYLRKIRDAGRMMTNEDTGWKIGLSRDSIGELTNFDSGKLNMLLALPRITRVAVLAESRDARQEQETGRGGRPSIRAFHILYAPVRVNQDLRVVRLVVREDVNGHFAYDFQRSDVLEKLNPAPAGIPAIKPGARQNTGSGGPAEVARSPGVVAGARRPTAGLTHITLVPNCIN